MALRIAQWATGPVGAAAARKVIEHPDFELVACHAFGAEKVGRDVGDLIGLPPSGIKATNRIEDIIAAKPDCVLYMPLVWDVEAMAQLLEAGINVISTANYITGRSYGQAAVDRLEQAAQKGGVTLHGTGINPGLANAYALAMSAQCAEFSHISVLESVDATEYASAETWIALGYGSAPDTPGLADAARERSLVFEDAVEMMADGLGIVPDEIAFKAEFGIATKDLALGYMDIGRGTVCGLKMTYSAVVDGHDAISLSTMWRLGDAMEPDWQGEGYVIEIEGTPSIRCVFDREGDPSGGGLVTAMSAVHAIPAVCAARPGIVQAWELPMVVARHCYRP
ncbi:MAG: hypothetical protein KDE32_05405 [Novosphingobium sp.]|nr:hypothetical protein [Novosphingobium sp.]